MITETPVTFVNRNGCRLFGMLYAPASPGEQRIGVLISVNAVKYRLGTFRFHMLLARHLSALGYTVLSFDPEGIGDSEGEFEYKLLSQHYFDIQVGKYSNDLADAINYFVNACSLDGVLLFGLCGGAISVLIEGCTDPRVRGMMLLNIPVFVEDLQRQGEEDTAAKITSSEAATALLKGKLRRLIEPAFWRRVVTLHVDVREEARLVIRSATVLVRKSWQRLAKSVNGDSPPVTMDTPISAHRRFNIHFQRAFSQAMQARKNVLFLFAELDSWTSIFKSEFQDLALKPGNPYEPWYTLEVIQGANHIFSGADSQRQLQERIVHWLNQNFPIWRKHARAAVG